MDTVHNLVSPRFAPISQPRDGSAALANGCTAKYRQMSVTESQGFKQ